MSSVCVYLSLSLYLLCTSESILFVQSMMMGVGHELADCPAVYLDLYIYTNKYPNVKQLSRAINQA